MTELVDEMLAAATADLPRIDEPAKLMAGATGANRINAPAIAREPDILTLFGSDILRTGIVGEERVAKLLFLALVTRFLDRPVSVAVKGPSGAGKSITIDGVLSFFPASAYFERTSMSARALAYTRESLEHRAIVLFEAHGMGDEDGIGPYLIRSLLSEGRLLYEYVDAKKAETVVVDKPGPTGLILSTTATGLHPENETRMLSVTVTDTPEQTRQVLRTLAQDAEDVIERKPWMDLQLWLERGEHRVDIPYSRVLVDKISSAAFRAVRLRRDFKAILSLIRAHAILHQLNRDRNDKGMIVATIADYGAVFDIVADVVSEGIGLSVSDTVRETVLAVDALSTQHPDGTPLGALAAELDVDKSVASRRAAKARSEGYLQNLEDRKGRPARYKLGEPLPETTKAIPEPVVVAESFFDETPATVQHHAQGGAGQHTDATLDQDEVAGERPNRGTVATVATVAAMKRGPLHGGVPTPIPIGEQRTLELLKVELGATETAIIEYIVERHREGRDFTAITSDLNRDRDAFPPPPGKPRWDLAAVVAAFGHRDRWT